MAVFDPHNPTFYGACIAIYDAANIVGSPLRSQSGDYGQYITYFYDDDAYETVSAGEAFRVAMWSGDFRSPKPSQTDPLDFVWVIECGAGSAGVLQLRDGKDPEWDPSTALTEHDLGTFTVNGATRVAVPTDVPTPKDVVGGWDAPVLHVECVSGSVQIRQVRMRVWPKGGPSGAWVSKPGGAVRQGSYRVHQSGPGNATVTRNAPRTQGWDPDGTLTGAGPQVTVSGGGPDFGGYVGESDDGFLPMAQALSGSVPPPYEYFRTMVSPYGPWTFGTLQGGWSYFRQRFAGPDMSQFEWGGQLGSQMAIIEYTPTMVFSTPDSWTHPDRIYWENSSQVQLPGGGPAYRNFERWDAGPQLEAGDLRTGVGTYPLARAPEQRSGETNYYSGVGFVTDYLSVEAYSAGSSSANNYGGAAAEIILPHAPVVAVEILTSLFHNPPSGMGEFEWYYDIGALTDSTGGSRYLGLFSTKVMESDPTIEYFDPALPWIDDDEPPTPTPRFFWLDEFGQWRAIGPGKPADDPVLLRIKTAMGWYREPRHGEDVEGHGAHPLKVKTSEGYGAGAWDTPVWMTPLD